MFVRKKKLNEMIDQLNRHSSEFGHIANARLDNDDALYQQGCKITAVEADHGFTKDLVANLQSSVCKLADKLGDLEMRLCSLEGDMELLMALSRAVDYRVVDGFDYRDMELTKKLSSSGYQIVRSIRDGSADVWVKVRE
jgi:hypothetical protein